MKHTIKGYRIFEGKCQCPDCIIKDPGPHEFWYLVYQVDMEFTHPDNRFLVAINRLSYPIWKGGILTKMQEKRKLLATHQTHLDAMEYVRKLAGISFI